MTATATRRRVFISFAAPDRKWALEFAEELRSRGVETLHHELVLTAGETIASAFETGIRAADDIVFLVSHDIAARPWMFFEFGVASMSGKRFIPVVPGDLDLSSFPVPMQSRRYVTRRSPEQTAAELYDAEVGTRTA